MAPISSTEHLPAVLVISLDDPGFLDDMYKSLFTSLAQNSRLTHVRDSRDAIDYFDSNNPAAILITDPGIVDSDYAEVLAKAKEYISRGGTAIFACMFSSFITPDDFDSFFKTQFQLPWMFGDYLRTTAYLNMNARDNLQTTQTLPRSYSQKAVFMKNVEAAHALYAPTQASESESFAYAGRVNPAQTPVAWAKAAGGTVGYVGDVNGEEGSNAVVLSMCGI